MLCNTLQLEPLNPNRTALHHLPKYGLLAQVSPENHLLVKVCIQSHRVPLLLQNLSVLLPLQTQTTNVTAVGEHQTGLLT